MAKENFKFSLKRLYLNIDNNEEKNTTLEMILKSFLDKKLLIREEITKDEKEIILSEVKKLENGDYCLSYELINFGKINQIKNRKDLTKVGEIKRGEYLERYQYIYFSKKDSNNYNIAFQTKKQGISYNKFYNMLYNFYEEYKKEQTENLSDTLLLSSSYYSKNFFEKIKDIEMVSTLTVEGGYENPDLKFAGIDCNKKFRCSTENITKVKAIGKRYQLFLAKDIIAFLKEQEEKYGTIKIKLHGKDLNNKFQKIYSDNLELSYEFNINSFSNKKDEYNLITVQLQKNILDVLKGGWVEISEN